MRKALLSTLAMAGIAVAGLGAFWAQPAEAAVYNPACTVASLRANLASAALLPGPHVVVLPANCVYTFTNTAPTNPDSALPAIIRNVVILGNGSTFIRDAAAPPMRFLEVRGGVLAVNNLTLSGGLNPPADAAVVSPDYVGEANGGAIRCTDGGLILDAVGISGNEATNGGGIFAEDCDVAIADSYITKNEAAGGDGGGMIVTKVDGTDVFVAMDRSHIWDNDATENGGGALLKLDRFAIDESEVLRNDAMNGDGGGLHVTTFDVPSEGVSFSTISDNTAGGDGGGLWMAPLTNGSIKVSFSTVSNNVATNGGGLVMAYGGIHRSTITGNVATIAGGGLLTNWATVGLDRATVADNTSLTGVGNAIGGSGTIYPTNALVGYTGAAPAGTFCDETAGLGLYPASIGSLSEGPCLGFTTIAAGSAALQPLFGNGGPTMTHSLGAGSLAIDAGDQPSCDAVVWMGDHDQRGLPYVMTFGAACDVGSYEVQ